MPRQATRVFIEDSAIPRLLFCLCCAILLSVTAAFGVTRTVTSSANSGANTLRALIGASADGDVIEFDASISTITLTTQIEITTSLTITGPAADELTISGGSSSRIFYINGASKTVTIAGIKFLNGRSQATPILNQIAGGGAIFHSQGTLNIDECEFEGNVADDGNGTTSFGYGGAIMSQSTLNITNSTFFNNSLNNSNAYGGGAIYVQDNTTDHNFTLNNCTFVDNSAINGNAAATGGAVYVSENVSSGTDTAPLVTITNCTFYSNDSNNNGEELLVFSDDPDVSITLRNNIFDRDAADGNDISVECSCSGGITATSNGGNIYWDTPDAQIPTGGTRDQTAQGVDGAGLSGTLALNGGPTRTIDITSGTSLADDNGVSGGPTLARDQRDFTREGNPDSGAFEFEGLFTFETLFPADNSTNASVTTNLVLHFAHDITIGSGNVLIKDTGDNTLETIDVQGVAVTGDGTKTITINPTLSLPGSTGVYVEVPQTAFQAPDSDSEFQAISGSSTWNFQTAASPNSAPIISTTNTAVAMLEDGQGAVYVTISDNESSTINLVLTAASDDISIVPTSNIVQIGLTRATTCFRITTANANQNGNAGITITVTDEGGLSASTTFALTITAVNDAPSFNTGANVTVLEDSGAFSAGFATGIDDGDPELVQNLSFDVTTANAALFAVQPSIAANGDLSFTPAANANGSASIDVFLQDDGGTANGGQNTSATQTFTITVTSVNDAPSFNTGANVTVLEDSGAFSAAFATGIDDGDPEAVQNLTFNVTNNNAAVFAVQPAIAANGVLSFTPAANANGVASVDVFLQDDGGTANGGQNTSATQTFTITVTSVNDAPSFVTNGNIITLEDSGAFTAGGVVSSIDDGDAEVVQNLTFVVTSANAALFSSQPTISVTGKIDFTLAANANGQAVLEIFLQDDGGTANGGQNTSATQNITVTVTPVNDAPSFNTGANVTVLEDSGAFSAGFATGIDDGDAETTQTLTFSVTNGNATLFSSQPSIATNGVLSFTPANNANGIASVDVFLQDDGGTANGGQNTSATQTFTITVTSVNDAPSFVTNGNIITLEDSGAFTAGGVVSSIDDGDAEVVQNLTFVVTSANAALFSSQATISVTGKIDFTLAANANGLAVLDIFLQDDGGTANGGQNTSATQNITVTVTPVNDAPSFNTGANVTVNEDSAAFAGAFATGIDDGDAETTQTLTFSVTNGNATLFSSQPTISATGKLNFTPAADANGVASVDVFLQDDGGTANGGQNTSATQSFSITVNAVNDAPSFNTGANVTVLEDSGAFSAGFATAIDDGDADAVQTVSFVVTTANAALFSAQPSIASNGDLSFTPAANANGLATVEVFAQDDGGTANGGQNTSATQTFTISVTPVNDAPSFNTGANVNVFEDAGPIALAFATSIDDGDAETTQTLTFSVTNGNASLFSVQPSIATNGVLSFTPANNANGIASVDVFLQDDGGTANGGQNTSATQTFTITVTSVNDAPSFVTNGNIITLEDSGAFTAGGVVSSIDDGDAEVVQNLTFVVTSANAALFSSQATISVTGKINFTLAANANGLAVLDIFLQDDGGTANGGQNTSATQNITVTVTPVNDAPSFNTGANVTVNEDSAAFAGAFATGIDDGDAETTQTLTFSVTNGNATLFSSQPTISATGKLNFTPAADANGVATVEVFLQDDGGTANGGQNTSATQSFSITVNAVNDAPSFNTGANVTVLEDSGAFSAGFATAIDDGDADAVQTVSFVVTTANAALFSAQPSIASNGDLSFTPAVNANGLATVEVFAQDDGGTANGGQNTSATQTFTISVTPVNDAPSFNTGANVNVFEDAGPIALAFATSIDDGDVETTQTLTFNVTNGNAALFSSQPTITAGGKLNFESASNATGSALVSVFLMDDGGTANGGIATSATQQFIIAVAAVNDPPTIVTNNTILNILEDQPAGFAVSISDPDTDVDALTVTATSANTAILPDANITQSGTTAVITNFVATTASNSNGTVLVTFTVSDGFSSTTTTITLNITPVNDAPSFITNANLITIEEAAPFFANGVMINIDDGDPETTQTLTFVTTTANAALFSSQPTISAAGRLDATLATNANGIATIDVFLQDNGGTANGGQNTSATQSFTIEVTAVNDVPSFSTGANVAVLEDSGQFTAGFATGIDDGDPETTQTLTFNVTHANAALFSSQPTISASGVLNFTPAANAAGIANVQVSLSDDGGTANGGAATSATQNFTIDLTPVNDAPSFCTGANVAVNEDSGAFAGAFATSIDDGDVETTQTLTFNVTNGNAALFSSQPTITATGKLNFTPAANANGSANVDVFLMDDGGTANGGVNTSATQSFVIVVNAVNDAPSFNTGANVTVLEDSGAFAGAFASAIDDGDPETTQTLTFNVTNSNVTLFSSQPTVSASGVLHFTPAADAVGQSIVQVSLADDGGTNNGGVASSATQSFRITVIAVNDAPSFATGANVSVNEDSGVYAGAFATSIDDGDSETTQTLSFSVTTANAVLFSSQPTITATGKLNFTPAANANGTANVDVFLMDDGGTANGGVNTSATQSFVIVVNAVNDAPSFNTGANVTVLEDSGAFAGAFASAIDDGDPETTQTLTFNVTNSNTTLFSSQPTVSASGVLHFTPAADAVGQSLVQLALADDGGTNNGGQNTSATQSFTIDINPVNDAPSFTTGANIVVDAGSSIATVFATAIDDGDPETSQTLTFHTTVSNVSLFTSLPTVSVSSGKLHFAVTSNTAARVFVSLSLSDDGGTANGGINTSATQQFIIDINNFNQAPVFSTGAKVTVAEDSGLYSAAFATGIDDGDVTTSQSLTFHVIATNATLFSSQPTISTTGVLSFIPATNATGTSAILVSLSDDGPSTGGNVNTSATQTFLICLTPINDAPTIADIADLSVQESGSTTINISIGDIDTPIGELQVTATSSDLANLTTGGISFSATSASMTLTLQPACGATGPVDVTVTVLDPDGPLTSSATFELQITPVQAFVITGSLNPCPRSAELYAIPAQIGASYNWEVVNGILLGGQGSTQATINWESGTTGTVIATIQTPGGCTSASALTVTSTNIAANPDFVATTTGASVTFNVLTNDEGSSLVLLAATMPENGSLTTTATGQVTYTPDAGFEGFDSFTYTIVDDNGCLETGASVQVVISDQVDQVNLHFVESQRDRVGGVRGLRGARSADVSSDDKHVYVAGQLDNSIAWFERSLVDGSLSYGNRARHNKNGVKSMRNPTSVVLSPDAKHAYVAAYGSGAVVVFSRDAVSGSLTYLERKVNGKFDAGKKIVGISRPLELVISGDGKTIYVSGYSDHSVAVFRRDVNSGLLQFIERHKDGTNGVEGLRYPIGLSVSPDGKNLYVAGSGDNAIAVFDRNVTTGKLTYVERYKDGNAGVDGIADVSDVCVSPDGNNVYAAGFGDEAVAIFDRVGDGTLSYVDRIVGGLLDGVHGITCSPNGTHVYTAASIDDAVAVLERDPDTGELEYLEALRQGVDGVNGLNDAKNLVVSKDGRYIWAAAYDGRAVTTIYRNRVPKAKDDVIQVVKNTSIAISVLDNDVEKDAGEVLEVTSKTNGLLGVVNITGGGTTITYVAGLIDGGDSFSYTAEDGKGGSSTATVSVVVTAPKRGQDLLNSDATSRIRISPNPVNSIADIDLFNVANSRLDVFLLDMQGRRVADLFEGDNTSDMLRLVWDSRNQLLPAGTYILRVERRIETGATEQRQAVVHIVR